MKKNDILLVLGILILVFAVFSTKVMPHNTIDIDVPAPSQNISEEIKNISKLITDKKDRAEICIFNKVFADRLIKYETDQQKLNDVYVLAAKNMFKDSLAGKYNGLDELLIYCINNVTGDDNHILSDEEKTNIQNNFYATSWYLK